MKIELYDTPLCCSSGLCGPVVDPVLVRVNDAVLALRKQGVSVERFNLTQQPSIFMSNKEVADLLHKHGKNILPITIANGKIVMTGGYPTYEELCKALELEPLKPGKPMTIISTE
jgi:hypothetical protein